LLPLLLLPLLSLPVGLHWPCLPLDNAVDRWTGALFDLPHLAFGANALHALLDRLHLPLGTGALLLLEHLPLGLGPLLLEHLPLGPGALLLEHLPLGPGGALLHLRARLLRRRL
jgi:hypothetical protein